MYPKKGPLYPRLFNEVLEAISTLKESKGSTKKNIVDEVEHILSKKIKRLRHDSSQIQRALKHGISNGLIKSRNGKYVLGMNQKDYGVFRKLHKLSSGGELGKQVRRRRSKKKRKQRPRRRRRHSDLSETDEGDEGEYEEDDEDDEDDVSKGSDTCASPGSGSPEDKGRRRGRKRKKRRRSRRRKRDRIMNIHGSVGTTENQKSSKSSDDDSIKLDNNGFDAGSIDKPTSPNKFENNEEPVDSNENQCDKPDCLCNTRKNYQ